MNIIAMLFKNKVALTIAGVIVVVVGGIAIAVNNGDEKETVVVRRGTLADEVVVSGKIVPREDIDLAFERSGRVVRVNAKVGDRVVRGETIVALDASELLADLEEAEAGVQSEEARLAELRQGTRPEEIRIKETALKQAEQSLNNTKNGVIPVLGEAFASADDAVRKQMDPLFTRDEEIDPKITYEVSDTSAQFAAEAARFMVTSELNTWRSELDGLYAGLPTDSFEDSLDRAEGHLITVADFLNKVGDTLISTQRVPADTLASYKTALGTARAEVASSLTKINNASQSLASAKLTVEKARNDLDLALAGSTEEAISAQEARLSASRARVSKIRASLSKMSLRSPINGIVTSQEARIGELVFANDPVVSLISDSSFNIEVNIPEIDIGVIEQGSEVRITFDAFPGSEFTGSVASIEPAETIVDGTVNFKADVVINEEDARIKSGMTANLTIVSFKKEGVLILPRFAILDIDGKEFVDIVRTDGSIERVPVTLGMQGLGGIEVLSGVEVGDKVLIQAD